MIDPNFTASWLLLPLLIGSAAATLFAFLLVVANPVASRRCFMVAGLLSLPALSCALLLRYGTSPLVLASHVDPSGKYEIQTVILHHGGDYDERGYISLVDTTRGHVLKSDYCGINNLSVTWDKQSVLIVCSELSGKMKIIEWRVP